MWMAAGLRSPNSLKISLRPQILLHWDKAFNRRVLFYRVPMSSMRDPFEGTSSRPFRQKSLRAPRKIRAFGLRGAMFGREAFFEGFEGSPFQEARLGGPGTGVPSA